MSAEEEKHKAIEKALGEPFMPNFEDSILKMRTHLLMGGVIALGAVLLNIQINSASPIFGISFKGLTEGKVYFGLLLINLYLLIHFFWTSFDNYLEWRLRLTGNKVVFQSGGFYTDPNHDYPLDPRQSTLYTWWRENSKSMVCCNTKLKEVEQKLDELTDSITQELGNGQAAHLVNFQNNLSEVRKDFYALRETFDKAANIVDARRVPASLARFDAAYRFFLKTQSLRWLLIEWLVPVSVGIFAVWVLAFKVTRILW